MGYESFESITQNNDISENDTKNDFTNRLKKEGFSIIKVLGSGAGGIVYEVSYNGNREDIIKLCKNGSVVMKRHAEKPVPFDVNPVIYMSDEAAYNKQLKEYNNSLKTFPNEVDTINQINKARKENPDLATSQLVEVGITRIDEMEVILVEGVYLDEAASIACDVEHYLKDTLTNFTKMKELKNDPSKVNQQSEQIDTIIKSMHESMSQIHSLGFVHGDIAPRNFMVKKDGHVKLIDFGMTLAFDEHGLADKKEIGGRPDYMYDRRACSNQREVSVHTDHFSLRLAIIDSLGMYMGQTKDQMFRNYHLPGLEKYNGGVKVDHNNYSEAFGRIDDKFRLENALSNLQSKAIALTNKGDPRGKVVNNLIEKYQSYIVNFEHEKNLALSQTKEQESFASTGQVQSKSHETSIPSVFSDFRESVAQHKEERKIVTPTNQQAQTSDRNIFSDAKKAIQDKRDERRQSPKGVESKDDVYSYDKPSIK